MKRLLSMLLIFLCVCAAALAVEFSSRPALTASGDQAAAEKAVRPNPDARVYMARFFAMQKLPEALTLLGSFYESGEGVIQDMAAAADLYGQAAERGYGEAQYRLASLYERGCGVPQCIATAKEWYGRACEDNYEQGCTGYDYLSAQGY